MIDEENDRPGEQFSPAEKLQDDEPTVPPPGAENPTSEEVKQEQQPNTE